MQKVSVEDYQTRGHLKKFLNKKVRCRGTFSGDVRYLGTHYHPKIVILLRNVYVNHLPCSHIWLCIEEDLQKLKLSTGSIIEFNTVVEEYKGKELEDKYSVRGITDLIVVHREELVEEQFYVKTGSLRYYVVYLKNNGKPEDGVFYNIKEEFKIKTEQNTRLFKKIELRYVKNYKNSITLAIYLNGKRLKGATAFFNPYSEKYGFHINGKYYFTVSARSYRELCSLFFQKCFLEIKEEE